MPVHASAGLHPPPLVYHYCIKPTAKLSFGSSVGGYVVTFVIYDFETTGTSPAYDQPVQFGAIVVDDDFAELDRVNLRCRLAPHIVPSPTAMVVTGVMPEDLISAELLNYFEFSQTLYDFIGKWSPAIWIGYNSIKFDEMVMRQMFYQNLLPNIYATQSNGNSRLDFMHVIHAVRKRAPEILQWPLGDNGKISFKLDRLAPANGVAAHNAHDALGDVEATLALMLHVAKSAPQLWVELVDCSDKHLITDKLNSFEPLGYIVRYGGWDPKEIIGCLCGYDDKNKNKAAFIDLEAPDVENLLSAHDDDLLKALKESPLKIRSIAINQAPALLRAKHAPDEVRRRATLVAQSPEFQKRISQLMAQRYDAGDDEASELSVEEAIFSGLYSNSDRALLERWRKAPWDERHQLLRNLQDTRLKQLGLRLVAFYAPAALTPQEAKRYDRWLKETVTVASDQGSKSRRSWQDALEELDLLYNEGRVPVELLNAMRVYFRSQSALHCDDQAP